MSKVARGSYCSWCFCLRSCMQPWYCASSVFPRDSPVHPGRHSPHLWHAAQSPLSCPCNCDTQSFLICRKAAAQAVIRTSPHYSSTRHITYSTNPTNERCILHTIYIWKLGPTYPTYNHQKSILRNHFRVEILHCRDDKPTNGPRSDIALLMTAYVQWHFAH